MTLLRRSDQLRDLVSLREAMNQLFEDSIVRPRGAALASRAKGTRSPAFAFAAPQTTWNSFTPSLTRQTLSRSASGCGARSRISPTTTPETRPAAGVTASTSSPAIVSWAASSCVDNAGLTHSLNHFSLNFIASSPQQARPKSINYIRYYCYIVVFNGIA